MRAQVSCLYTFTTCRIADNDYRKHLKRHAKPFGCTFPCCDKKFGSKNDWKRHENSQHYRLQFWRCNLNCHTDPKETCTKTYKRREQFKIHLLKDHQIVDPAAVDRRLEFCLDSRSYEVSFWCGFCKQMVKANEKGLKAWQDRFNHISDHFNDGRDVSEWMYVEPRGSEVTIVLPEIDEPNQAKSSTTTSAASVPADGTGRSLKRSGNEETQYSRPQKKPRASTNWSCVSSIPSHSRPISWLTIDVVRL